MFGMVQQLVGEQLPDHRRQSWCVDRPSTVWASTVRNISLKPLIREYKEKHKKITEADANHDASMISTRQRSADTDLITRMNEVEVLDLRVQ